MAEWTEWTHDEPVPVNLPSGEVMLSDRGAEQGDPHGSLQCGLVLGGVACRARNAVMQSLEAARIPGQGLTPAPGFLDVWFADDGQIVCRPDRLDSILRKFDEQAAQVGATRGSGADVKSTVKIVGHPSLLEPYDDTWATAYVKHTCSVLPPNSESEVLGICFGASGSSDNQVESVLGKIKKLHDCLAHVDDPGVEMVLGRQCADVSKLAHLLRSQGPSISRVHLDAHDSMQRAYVERVVAAELDTHASVQMTLGVADSGLGFRRATDVAIPAFVASRIESRPYVVRLFAAMHANGVGISGLVENYDATTADALNTFLDGLTLTGRTEAVQLCEAGAASAEAQAQAIEQATSSDARGPPVERASSARRLVHTAGSEDDEYPDSFGSRKLQRGLCKIVDAQRSGELTASLTAANRQSALRRVQDLRDPTVNVDWMWKLNRAHGGCVEGEDYAHAIRMRLGASGADSDALCGCCGAAYLGGDGAHCLCCAPAASTKGHNSVRNELLDFARLADATSEIETPGLISAALGLRPADVLISVAGIGLASSALDVGVAAPDAVHAGRDCAQTMFASKIATYRPHLSAMAEDGVSYIPMIWTAWGREHPETTRVLDIIAKRAARRRGAADHRAILRRARGLLGSALVRRGVAMLKACRPRRPPGGDAAAGGESTADGEDGGLSDAAALVSRDVLAGGAAADDAQT